MGPSIVYSERSNEELEELFRTIIVDEEFLNVCQREFEEQGNVDLAEFTFPRKEFDYEEVSTNPENDNLKPQVVHEINMSVYYNIEVDRNNPDLTFVKRYINIVPEVNDQSSKKNRFSNLNLPNDIDRLVKMHDYMRHSQQQSPPEQTKPTPNKKPPVKRRQTQVEPKRRSTISTANDSEQYDAAALAQLVEQQLEAARRASAMKNFNPIANPKARIQPPVNRAKFVPPPILNSKPKEPTLRSHVNHIEFPKSNLNRLLRRPLTFIDNLVSQPISSKNEREKLLTLSQQGIISSAVALGSQRIPDNIKSIELLEIPTTKKHANQYQDFRLIGYETHDNYPLPKTPLLRRTKSMKHVAKPRDMSSKRSSTILTDILPDSSSKLTSPLKSIKRHIHQKHESAIQNKPVSKENGKGNKL